jgi:hypothetical protein
VIASSVEASVQKCVNRTRDFFVHGIRPLRGLDEVCQQRSHRLVNEGRAVLNAHGSQQRDDEPDSHMLV